MMEDGSGSVALFHRGNIWGGAEETLVFNASDLRRRGIDAFVLCMEAREVADRYESEGVPVHRILVPESTAPRRTLARRVKDSLENRSKTSNFRFGAKVTEWVSRRELSALRSALQETQPSVFFSHMSAGNDYQFLRLAAGMGLGTISLQQIAPPEWTGRRHLLDLNAQCGWFVSNSEFTRRHWIAKGLRQERHEVVYYTIPSLEPAKESLRDRIGLSADARLFGSVGRLDRSKRFDKGIRAFASTAAKHPQWHYLIIGSGAERDALMAEASRCGVSGRVHLVGELRNAASFLGQLDVFFHPTRGEHFGRVVAEAMLQETITIGHASGGVPEMILDGETGFLFTDDESLADRLERAMSGDFDPSMKAAALKRIRGMCGPEKADRIAEIVDSETKRTRRELVER